MKEPALRVLLFSTLFPSAARPTHGIFVETRLRELLKTGAVDVRVVAPVPWFPSTAARFGERARIAATAAAEQRHGVAVLHPRYALIPKFGMTLAPLFMALACVATLRRLRRDGFDFDLIDAHYYYPDGVAAALLARWFKRPLAITARGTDLNLVPQYALPRLLVFWAARRAEASIGVCAALMDVLRQGGVAESRLTVLRNGIDLQRFAPPAERPVRAPDAPLLLSVGHLVERKGHHLVIEALALLRRQPGFEAARLAVIGAGEEDAALQALAGRLHLHDCVEFTGALPQADLPGWYGRADALVLASSREGWANVLLEAMACGTPVVATDIWGTPEVVAAPEAGVLVSERSAQALCSGLARLLARPPARSATRAYAEGFSWEATSAGQLALFRRITGRSLTAAGATTAGATTAGAATAGAATAGATAAGATTAGAAASAPATPQASRHA